VQVCILKTPSVLVSDAINKTSTCKLKAHARALSSFLLFTFPIARGLSYQIHHIKRAVSARTDTLLMCASTPTTTWTTTMDHTYHQEEKKILTARSKLSLLLHRCLTPATINTPSQTSKVCRHAAGSNPSPSKMGVALPRRTHYGVRPTAGNTTLESTQTTRIRVASQTHTHLLSRPSTMGSRRKTLCGRSGSSRLLLWGWVHNYYYYYLNIKLPALI